MSTQEDPFGGEFSQSRVSDSAPNWVVCQWHRGIPDMAGTDDPKVQTDGGFFLSDDHLSTLGINPDTEAPFSGFERTTLRLGGNPVKGWGARRLEIAFIFHTFAWEEKEATNGQYPQRFATWQPNTRGRTRCLVGIRELLEAGIEDPVLLTVRGTYSEAVNTIHREVRRMAKEATKLRKAGGHEGAVPREAFFVPIYAGPMTTVGKGSQSSKVSLPTADIPQALKREYLVERLVPREWVAPGGLFDQWAEQYAEPWEKYIVQGQPQAEGEEHAEEPTGNGFHTDEEEPLPSEPTNGPQPTRTTQSSARERAQAAVTKLVLRATEQVRNTSTKLTPETRESLIDVLLNSYGFNPYESIQDITDTLLNRPATLDGLKEHEGLALVWFFKHRSAQTVVDEIWPPAPAQAGG